MYKAIWQTGELGVVDKATGRLKTRLPTIEQVAKFYERVTGVKAADFVNASKSFGVDMKVKQSDAQILAMRITGTPSIVVNGKYVLNSENLPTIDDYIAVIKFLIAKETKK
jgi:thiol:disulfide interchange protein DsbA